MWEWFQTRSYEGVQTVLNSMHNLQAQARLIQATELEDPDTSVIFPEPRWGNLSLPQLRERLGIDRILSGSAGMRIVYRDRYLNEKGARILADLLQGDGLDANSSVTIWVLEDAQSQPASERKAQLEEALAKLQDMGVSTSVKVQPWHQRSHFPHARELEIHKLDGDKYKVIFDRGLDFLEAKLNGIYRVTNPTYVVLNQDSRI